MHPEDERYKDLIGKTGGAAAGRARDPDHRRRVLRSREGLGRGEDHAGARLQRLRGRQAPRPATLINIFDATAQLNDERAGEISRARPLRGAQARRRRSRGAGPRREDRAARRTPCRTRERGNAVVEPWLTDQWYVNAAELAKPAIAAVEDGKTKFVPEELGEDLLRVDAQHPALVHLAPALVGPSDPGVVRAGRQDVRRRTTRPAPRRWRTRTTSKDVALKRDEDVLDTWFSSALWPFSTLGWPDKTPELTRYYPTSVLVTGFDIIFFWVARMMMMGLHFMGEVPFHDVYIHALVRDEKGAEDVEDQGQRHGPAWR